MITFRWATRSRRKGSGRGVQFELILRRTDPAHIERQPLPPTHPGAAATFCSMAPASARCASLFKSSSPLRYSEPPTGLIEGAQLDAAIPFAAEQRRSGVSAGKLAATTMKNGFDARALGECR